MKKQKYFMVMWRPKGSTVFTQVSESHNGWTEFLRPTGVRKRLCKEVRYCK